MNVLIQIQLSTSVLDGLLVSLVDQKGQNLDIKDQVEKQVVRIGLLWEKYKNERNDV